MASSEIEFLRNQVQRLNDVLSNYQENYPAVLTERTVDDEIPAQWLTDRGVLSPLLFEYDQIIKSQQEEFTLYKKEQQELRHKIGQLISENDRILKDLKESVESEMQPLSTLDLQLVGSDDQMLQNFQQQIQMAVQEKEVSEEKWRGAAQEIDRLVKELEAEKESHQWKVVEQQAHQVKDQYLQTVAALNSEIEALQRDLRQARAELNTSELQVSDLRQMVTDLQHQLQWKDQESVDAIFKEGITDTKVVELKRILEDLRQKVSLSEREISELKNDKTSLETRVTELQKRNFEAEEKEAEAIMQVRDAIQMVENAVVEKDEVEIQCHQKDEELEQMQEVINKLINEAGMRTRQEVNSVRKQYNERISKLTEELHGFEMENAEKQAQLERLLREKRSVESELEQIYREGIVQGSKQRGAYEEFNKRAIDADRARDEAEVKVEKLQNTLRREVMNNQQLKTQLESQMLQMKERMTTMELEFENLNEERLHYLDDIDELKRKLQSAQAEKEASQRKYLKESTIQEQSQKLKARDYEVKLQSTEDSNRHAMVELRKLLNAQQRMSARWKAECQTITQKFEIKVNDLRSEVSQLKKRNDELTSLVRDGQEKTMEAERMISDYTKNIRRMEERVRESEIRARDAATMLSRNVVKERQMVSERESLLQKLSRSRRESTHSVRGQALNRAGNLTSSDHLTPSFRMAGAFHEHTNGVAQQAVDLEDMLSER